MFRIDQYLVPCSNSENKGKRNPSHHVRFKCKVVRNSVNQLVKSVTNSELSLSHYGCTECATLWACHSFLLPGMLLPRYMHSFLLRCLIRESLPDTLYQIHKMASPIFVLVFFLVSYLHWPGVYVCVCVCVCITICLIHYYWFCSFLFTAFLIS